MSKGNPAPKDTRQVQQLQAGIDALRKVPGFRGVLERCPVLFGSRYPLGKEDWGCVFGHGEIWLNTNLDAEPKEWAFVLAYLCYHLIAEHFQSDRLSDSRWHNACGIAAAKYVLDAKIGSAPLKFQCAGFFHSIDEEQIYIQIQESQEEVPFISAMGDGKHDMRPGRFKCPNDWPKLFASDLQWSIRQAMRVSAGLPEEEKGRFSYCSAITQAVEGREWFISSYPLLGAIAADFKIITDWNTTFRQGISVAAVSATLQEIYINPRANLTKEEWKFVLAHEFLHAALRHDVRCEGREPELWNVACDFVINLWLREMGVGQMPNGLLYDERFRGLSAEQVYDQLLNNLRYYRGLNPSDLLYGDSTPYTDASDALDDYYRRAIARGLEYQQSIGRGNLPLGLIEEIYALSHRPIPWDVELAKWFDEQFAPIEPKHTYARISRRQSATPNIPRPAWVTPEEQKAGRIFAVILDTSGSMDRHILAQALGAVASYAEAREVRSIRLIFCDAAAYDQGVIAPEDLADAVKVRGRGGTVLQPGVDLLDADKKIPQETPVLIISDGECDHLNLHGRTHAYLIPKGKHLPFPAKGPIFRLES